MRLLFKVLLLIAAMAMPMVLASDSFAESGCHRNGPPRGGGSASG